MKGIHFIFLGLLTLQACQTQAVDAFVAEATEIIGVVRIGVSLVEYMYKGKSKFMSCQFTINVLNIWLI